MTGDGESTDAPGVSALVSELTGAEKLSLVRGTYPGRGERDVPVAGYLPPVERVGVGPLRLADGPLGVRSGEATAFPATLALGAAFDPSLAAAFGRAVGAEARERGIDVLLAPGCNLLRVPQCGRAFEYYGEDPYHAGQLAAAAVRGIQSQGVVATPKHYVANTQEYNRVRASAEVSERALRELYLRAFEAAVREGDARAVMAAYNRVNGTYATHNERLLSLLREEFGFDGPVVSDWWAVRDGLAAAQAGLDLEMPGVGLAHVAGLAGGPGALHTLRAHWPDRLFPDGLLARLFASNAAPGGVPTPHASRFAQALPAAIDAGTLDPSRLDEMVARVLRLHEHVGALGDRKRQRADPDEAASRDLAERIAVRGTVLVENDGTLPLDPTASVAVIGPNIETAKVGGGGSSAVTPARSVSPALGIRERAVGPVTVAPGHPPLSDTSLLGAEFEWPSLPLGEAGPPLGDALAAAETADVAVVVLQDEASEFRDRATLGLPGQQDRLVEAVAGVAERTVVVLQTAGPVALPWLDAVDAVLELWYPGQEAGRALAAVLYGDADPGGRLPVTFAAAEDYPATDPASYPGVEGAGGYPEVTHAEGVFVGYRYLDDRGLDPVFPFGHGSSYTTFAYEDADPALAGGEHSVQVRLANTGERRGREVLQVYARPPETEVPRPPRELAGFASVALAPGEHRTVEVPLDDRAFARYDEAAGEWVVDPGTCTLSVGRSAREPCLELAVEPTS